MLKTIKKHVIRPYHYHQLISSGSLGNFRGYIVDDSARLHQAKRLHAATYLRRGFIEDHHIEGTGYMTAEADPHQYFAEYFVVCEMRKHEEQVKVTVRQIREHNKQGFGSFPILSQAKISDRYMNIIHRYEPKDCVEISGLVKAPGTTTLATFMAYRMMWHHSLRRGDKIWLMACAPALYARLKSLFGPAVVQIGRRTPYMGEDVIPAMAYIQDAAQYLEDNTKTLHPTKRALYRSVQRFFTENLPEEGRTK